MPRTGLLCACLLSAVLLARPAEPAAEGGADELLKRTLDALGGDGALSEIRSIVSTADIEIPDLGIKGTMTSRRMMPCLYRIDIRLGFFEISQGCDGDGMWRIDSNGMLVHLLDPESAAERVTVCLIESYRYLLSDEGYRAAVAGSDTVGGASCTVLEIVPEGGIPCRLSIDDATGLPVRLSMTTKNGPVSETYGDFRPVGGVMFPHSTSMRQAAVDQTIVARTLSIEVNEPVDPLLFLPPPGSADDYSFTGGGGSAMVPFTTHDRHIYIPVRLHGSDEELIFMVDSGASMTVIDSTLAVRMGYPLGERMTGAAAGGTASFQMTRTGGFSIEGVSFAGQTVIAYPLAALFEPLLDIEVAGILGYDFLSRFVTRIDYEKSILTLFEPDSAAVPASIDAPLVHNVFSIEGTVDGRYTGTFLIDTGAGNSMLQKGFVEEHHLLDDRQAVEISLLGAGGEESAHIARFDSFEIGGFTIERPLFALSTSERGIGAFPGISGIIGNDILQRFTVILDYGNQRIALEKNGLFDMPAAGDRSGIAPERDPSKRPGIRGIAPESPADIRTTAGKEIH